MASNVQKYVEHNSYGQRPITKSNPFWNFYAKVIGMDSTKKEESSWHSEIRHENAATTERSSEKTREDQGFTKDVNFTEYYEQHSLWDRLPINKNELHSNWDDWDNVTEGQNSKLTACSSHSNWDKVTVDWNLESIACSTTPFENTRDHNPCTHPQTHPNEQNTQSTKEDLVHLTSKTDQQSDCSADTTVEARSPWIQRSSFGGNREVFRKTKLLILDVNGLLADFLSYEPYGFKADSMLGDKAGKV